MFFIPSVSMPNIVCVVPNSMMKFYLQIALTKNSWQRFFCYCSVKQMPWPFCQANSVAGNMCSGRKNRKFTNISIILRLYQHCAVDCVFQTNVVYVFLEGNDLNIAFQFVILLLQNYIQRNKLYNSIWNIFTVLGTKSKVIIFGDVLASFLKRMFMCISDTIATRKS